MWVAKRPWCRRVDWYIWLRNVGKTELLVVIRSPSRTRLKVVDSFVCVCVGGV